MAAPVRAAIVKPRGGLVVIGEALIDLVETGDDDPRLARPGGSPYNVVLGLARLGRAVQFAGRLSGDPLGVVLRNHALRSGVDLSLAVDAPEPTTVALVELDAAGVAAYRFGVEGTADFRWTDAELARVPDTTRLVHFGSLASWLPPGDAVIERRVGELRAGGALVTYDPNVRPRLQPDAGAARAQVERAVRLAHVVKTSEEDLAHLYGPDAAPAEVAAGWLALGPALVVVTRGGDGAVGVTRDGMVERPSVPVEVVDTVGAGDAFMSGLLDELVGGRLDRPAELERLSREAVAALLDRAALVAAATCARAGANPPRRAELERWAESRG
ncbi:carbohydrate kinase [uncultured Jatrophihabitans sp.]|uniref:carbohydrate kinase family protein n=1 Tax=uncultured Jatrophihabitans sp. TaxID=1610747 RepID=UPI0035CA7C60